MTIDDKMIRLTLQSLYLTIYGRPTGEDYKRVNRNLNLQDIGEDELEKGCY